MKLVASALDLFHRRELDVQLLDALAGEGDLRDGPLDGDDRAAAELAVLDRVARLQRSGRGPARRLLRVGDRGRKPPARERDRGALAGLGLAPALGVLS